MMLSLIRGTCRQRAIPNLLWNQGIGSASTIRPFSSSTEESIRLSKLLSQYATNLAISRRQAERLINEGEVTLAGEVVRSPQMLIDWKYLDSSSSVVLKVQGKPVLLESRTEGSETKREAPKVWAVHKVGGEVVSENDPQGRPSMIQRLSQGGVGRMMGKQQRRFHLKPIGRLDMPTEGLILVTNDGDYARQMELPSSKIHRVYRARVHGRLTSYKLDRIRQGGVRHEDVRYGPMKLAVERPKTGTKSSTNTWVRITATEGKNRQIRNVFAALGVTVTRLIRIAYGDYELQSIPPGLAIQVPYKPVERQKAKGSITPKKKQPRQQTEPIVSPVRWIRSVQ